MNSLWGDDRNPDTREVGIRLLELKCGKSGKFLPMPHLFFTISFVTLLDHPESSQIEQALVPYIPLVHEVAGRPFHLLLGFR
jgi:hypothetical protein